jgi:uncharacterized protein
MRDPDIPVVLGWLRQRLTDLYEDRLVYLVLYGSHARGEAHPGSDVDLALVLQGPVDAAAEVDRTAEVVADAILEYGQFVSVYPLSVADYETAGRAVIRAVRAEGVSA